MDTHPVWKIIWERAVPPKVRIFNWRALHGFIPCLCTLANRHMKTPLVCQVCGKDTEDLCHILFPCDRATEVWKESGLLEVIEPLVNMERSGSVILENLLCADLLGGNALLVSDGIETIMVAAWYLWWDRRKKTHDEPVGSPDRSALSIKGIVANSMAMKAKKPVRRKKWERPAMGTIKLNVDASFHSDSGAGATGVGVLLRDSTGAFIAASGTYHEFTIDVPAMEAAALLEGLRLAETLGIFSVTIECGSMEIVHAIHEPTDYRASGAVIAGQP